MPEAVQIDDQELKDIFFGKPLYVKWVGGEEKIVSVISRLRTASQAFDHYCPYCEKETVWRAEPTSAAKEIDSFVSSGYSKVGTRDRWIDGGSFELQLTCERRKHHITTIAFSLRNSGDGQDVAWELVKFGQFPSLLDLNAGNSEFAGVLNNVAKREYRRALELTTYGFSIAAFLHYRRVLEMLIEQAKDEAVADGNGFDQGAFEALQTNQERVRALGDRIPQFIAERPAMYRILSEGVHQWSEDQCAAVLPLMKLAIDTVLGQERDRKAKINRQRDIELQLQKLDAEIANPGGAVAAAKK